MGLFLLGEVPAGTTGMPNIIAQLKDGITSAGLFGTVSEIIPFVIVMIGFAFGYKVLRKAVKGASKGKANI
ncbi:uncharacterized protein BN801_00659 [Mycoplasma sp. CAG:877]|nr:uncharacterized protein BN801_00659 [Mycoplasma sp. CAG:877]